MLKNWCFWTAVLKKTLESPLDCKEIKPVHPKGNQSWIFIGRTDAVAEAPLLWPPDARRWLIGKDPDAGKDWRQEEKGTTEDEIVGWHHQVNGQEFEQALGDSEGQEAWCAAVHGVTKSWTWLSDWTTTKSIIKVLEQARTQFGDIYFIPKSSLTQIIVSLSLFSNLLLKLYANYGSCIYET